MSKYTIEVTNKFKKDFNRCIKRGFKDADTTTIP